MAANFGRAQAEIWRRAAATPEHRDRADAFEATAAASEALAGMVADAWPVEDDFWGVRAKVEQAHRDRDYDPDNPDAMIDLHTYGLRVRAVIEPVAMCLGEDFDRFPEILFPLYRLRLRHSALMQHDWSYVLGVWANFLRPEPLPYFAVLESAGAEG